MHAWPTKHWLLAVHAPQVPSGLQPWPGAHWLAAVHDWHTPSTHAFPPPQSVLAVHAVQINPRQYPEAQSLPSAQLLPSPQPGQGPPQSMAVSAGALTPSVQVSLTQLPRVQCLVAGH